MADSNDPLDRRLRLKLRIYLLILAICIVILVVDVVRLRTAGLLPGLAGLAAGVVLGVLASRMTALQWDATNQRVVGRIDAIGAVVLIAYIALAVFRKTILRQLFDPALVGTASVAVLAGLMLGQVLGTLGGFIRIVRLARSGEDGS